MPRRATVHVAQTNLNTSAGAATNYIVQTPVGVLYFIYGDTGSDVAFKKSTDGGLTWSNPTIVFAGTIISLSVWYDRWSGIAAGLIHIAYTETGGNDTLYRTINTESSDALSTQTTIFAGTSVVITGSHLSIVRARGGNVYCKTQIDAGAEGGFFRLPNANVPNGAWDAARTINEALSTLDLIILQPGWAADTQDIFAIFWDISANEISRQIYDDSANSWAETSISTGMVEPTSPPTAYPNFACAVDITNSRTVLIAWNGLDTANADLLGWIVTESAITAFTTPVVLNGVDDQGLCGISIDIDTGWWYAFYGGKSDGSETFSTAINIYYKVSKDAGVTWGAETLLTSAADTMPTFWTLPRFSFGSVPPVGIYNPTTINVLKFNVEIGLPKGRFQLGI